jgi:hypothetical protein
MVLSGRSYQTQRERVGKLLTLLYAQRTLCFIGTTLDETYLLAEFEGLRAYRSGPAHVLITDSVNAAAITEGRAPISLQRHGIIVQSFEEGRWDALDTFSPFLSRQAAAIPHEPFAAATLIAADTHYVPNVFVANEEADRDEFVDALMAEAGLREVFTEQEIAEVGRRTVIVGIPGSGKSAALREIGRLAPAGEHPVLIYLAGVTTVGDPEELLARWAETGESLRTDQPIGADALQNLKFHFLLDSLDEAPPGQQERIARAINRLVTAFPQHRFTVASRKVAALSVLEEGTWQQLALSPGPEWRSTFLAAQGIDWPELLEAVPALRDLHELLRLPFFMRRVIELWQAGELDELESVWGLITLIVDRAIRADQLGIPADPLRTWLRKIAFSMQLGGRASLDGQEVAAIPMPLALRDYGTSDEIAERLAATPLLQQRRRGEYAFIHRLIGECLVAEELLMIGPAVAALDVVAPVVSSRIGGLREDWAVPVSLAASRDLAWRMALAERDDLASARAVPATAPPAERRAAGELIWRRYAEWEIWLFNVDQPDFMDAGQAIVRFLQAGDADDLAAEILDGLASQSPFIRGNALQTIGRAGLGSITDAELDGYITGDPNTVVRRAAAVAAARLGRTSLWPTIVGRLDVVTDEVEAQDLTLAAEELATDEQLFELAVKVAGQRHAFVLEHRLESRLKDHQLLLIYRERAAREERPLTRAYDQLRRVVESLGVSDDQTAETVGFIAVAWSVHDESVLAVLRANPRAAAQGMHEATISGAAYDYEVLSFSEVIDAASIQAAGFEQHVVQWFEQRQGG